MYEGLYDLEGTLEGLRVGVREGDNEIEPVGDGGTGENDTEFVDEESWAASKFLHKSGDVRARVAVSTNATHLLTSMQTMFKLKYIEGRVSEEEVTNR